MNKTSRLVGSAALITASLLHVTGPSHAQTPPPATTATPGSAANLLSFREQLKKLADQNHIVCLVEGEPPHDSVVPTNKAPNAPGATEADPLNTLVQQFDYCVERLPGNIIVLHKTYYDDEDLPSVTLDECAGALNDIERVLEAANPNMPSPNPKQDPLMDAFASFSEEQFAAMQRGSDEIKRRHDQPMAPAPPRSSRGGLPVADLTPAQKQGVWRIARFLYIQIRAMDAPRFAQQIDALVGAPPSFVIRDVSGVRLFGYETGGRFTPLSDPYHLPTEFDTAASYDPALKGIKDTIPPGYDPTLPKKRAAPTGDGKTDAITLQKLAEKLNGRAGANVTEPGKTIIIDRELMEKRLTVVGDLEKADPLAAIQAVAALYGLRVANGPDAIKLTRPKVRISDDPMQAWKSVVQLLPLPLQTVYRQEIRPNDPGMQKVTYVATGSTVSPTLFPEAGKLLAWAAVRRLRQTVEDKINRAPKKRISFDELDAEEKAAFAVVAMAPDPPLLVRFTQSEPPSYIARFNQSVLIGGYVTEANGRRWFHFTIGQRLPDGKLEARESSFTTPVDRK